MKTFKSILFLVFITLVISQSCKNAADLSVGLSVDTLKLADMKMQSYVDEGKLAGISTLILKDGKVAHQAIFGYANIEEGRMMDENTIFRIYSMSKPITAAALMMLYDEGKFQLDDPVSNYIPEFSDTKVFVDGEEVEQDQPFTIRHLMTHSAGFTYGWDPNSHVDSMYNNLLEGGIWTLTNLETMMKLIAKVPLKNQPGTKYEYSISIDVAGYLIEVLSGMTFDKFLQSRLFDPLKMEDSGFDVPEDDFSRLAMIYTFDKTTEKLTPVEDMTNGVKQKVTLFSGGGGLVSTIGDYAKFGEMLLNGGELNGVRVLKESTVDMIMSNQMPAGVIFQEGMGYGLAGYVNLETGEYGWSGAASTDFIADRKNNMVILSFTQHVPFMEVPFAKEFSEYAHKAIAEDNQD